MARRKDNGFYHNLRCSRNNPQHVYVNKILEDLNLDIYKSKNQYIIDAVEYYSRMLNQDDLTVTAAVEKARQEGVVTQKDLDAIKREISNQVKQEVQQQVIVLLGAVISGRNAVIPSVNTKTEQEEEFEQVDETVAGLAADWAD